MTEIIQEFWPQLLALVFLTAWLVRLESKVSTNIDRLEKGTGFQAEVRNDLANLVRHTTELKTDMKWLKEFGARLLNDKETDNN